MDRPTFMIVGAPKCATTSLHYYLGQHSDVCMSKPKEPRFFEAEYEKGLSYYWQTYFSHWQGELAGGEARTANLILPFVAERISKSLPHCRIVASLRHPADRAFSQWWMWKWEGWETLPFSAALEEDEKRVSAAGGFEGDGGARAWKEATGGNLERSPHPLYLRGGYYADHIERFCAFFPETQIKVILVDDLQREPESVVQDIWSFLGVDAGVPLSDPRRMGVAVSPGAKHAFRLVRRLGLKGRIPPALGIWSRKVASIFGKKPDVESATRRDLLEHYRPHNKRLEQLLGRDLSHWNK